MERKILFFFIFLIISSFVLYAYSLIGYFQEKSANYLLAGFLYVLSLGGVFKFSGELSEKIIGISWGYTTGDGIAFSDVDMGNWLVIIFKFFIYQFYIYLHIFAFILFFILPVVICCFVCFLAMEGIGGYYYFTLPISIILCIATLFYPIAKGYDEILIYENHFDIICPFLLKLNKGNPFVYNIFPIFNNNDEGETKNRKETYIVDSFLIESFKEEMINRDLEKNIKNDPKNPAPETLSELNEKEAYLRRKLEQKRRITELESKIKMHDDMNKINRKIEGELNKRMSK